MRKYIRPMSLLLTTAWLLLAATVAHGQNGFQQGLNNQAWQVQRGLNSGVINQGQAAQLDGQIYNIQQQQQVERAMNGGQLTGMERQQIGNEMRSVGQQMRGTAMGNGFNPQTLGNLGGGQHHHHNFNGVMAPYNQNGYNQTNYYRQGMMQNAYGQQYAQGYPGSMPYGNMMNGQYPGYGQQGGMSGAASLLRRLF